MPSYRRLQQYAIAISIISILYNSAEGAVSIAFGAEASSRSLVFFGVQSGIEVASAVVVLWRFKRVAKPGEENAVALSDANLRVEKVGTWTIGILIGMLALATEITAILGLAQHTEPSSSTASLIISASALVIMILIWLPKNTLARRLNSSTMAGEATCSLSCIQITLVLLVGSLVFRLWHGGWWVDNATSLILGLFFAREAWKMLRWVQNPAFNGGCCGECSTAPLQIERDTELGEQYRDMCECCNEKEECRNGDSCKCETRSDSEMTEDPCCVRKTSDKAACCTRELLQGPRPQRQVQQTCDEVRIDNDTCCSNKNNVEIPDECRDSCCQEIQTKPAERAPADAAKAATSCCQKGCC